MGRTHVSNKSRFFSALFISRHCVIAYRGLHLYKFGAWDSIIADTLALFLLHTRTLALYSSIFLQTLTKIRHVQLLC